MTQIRARCHLRSAEIIAGELKWHSHPYMKHGKFTLEAQNKRKKKITDDGVERDLYLFYIHYKSIYCFCVEMCRKDCSSTNQEAKSGQSHSCSTRQERLS